MSPKNIHCPHVCKYKVAKLRFPDKKLKKKSSKNKGQTFALQMMGKKQALHHRESTAQEEPKQNFELYHIIVQERITSKTRMKLKNINFSDEYLI